MISVQNRFRTAASGIPVLLLLLVSCGGRSGKAPAPEKAAARHFPSVSVPMAYDNDSVRLDYLCEHYWDGFFGGSGDTDSSLVLGVPKAELEQAFANYTAVLNMIGNPGTGDGDGMAGRLEKTDRAMLHLFSQLSARQRADSASALYTAFTQMVGSYLYDPNSPVRDEDLYLPFVREMAASDLTPDAMRTAYAYEASCCALNRRGSVAPDFRIKRADGSIFRLHSVKAAKTLLFFSNPGCANCREITEAIEAEPALGAMMARGGLAVVNVYIDEDLASWREHVKDYPPDWYTGYDVARSVREGRLYDIRAIPSLYLLDAGKRILLKDAPLDRVMQML